MKKHLVPALAILTAVIAAFLTGLFFGRKVSSSPIQISSVVSDRPYLATAATQPEELNEVTVTFPIDINKATVSELMTLPGIGEVLAQRIVEYRSTFGKFILVEELMDVNGIGENRFESIKDYIYIGG